MRIARPHPDYLRLLPPGGIHRPGADPAYAALPLLRKLADSLTQASIFLKACREQMKRDEASRGGVVTFLHEPHQPRPTGIPDTIAQQFAKRYPGPASAWTILPDLLDDAMTLLAASVYVRRAARAVTELQAGAEVCSGEWKSCRDLVDVLAMPEDETFLAIDPIARVGLRVRARALSTIAEFHMFLADIWPTGPRPDRSVIGAYRMLTIDEAPIATARFHLYHPRTLRPDGTLPTGFAGSDDWLWNDRPLASIPFVAGERTLLLSPPVYAAKWEAVRTLPFPVEPLQVIERLDEAAVLNWFRLVQIEPANLANRQAA